MGGYINTTPIVFFRSVSIYYSPKWKMIGPAAKAYIVNLELYQRRDLKRHILLTFGIGKIIFLFEMFSLFKNELTFVVCIIIISKQFSYLLSCGGVDFCGRALQKKQGG